MVNKRGNWSSTELERLRSLFPRTAVVDIARLLKRSVAAVRRRASELFTAPPRRGAWSEAEDEALRDAFGALELRDLTLLLARTQKDVKQRIEVLKTRLNEGRWTLREIRRLKRFYGSRSDQSLVVCIGRPVGDLVAAADRLRLQKDKRFLRQHESEVVLQPMPRWTREQAAELARLYPDHDNLTIAKRLVRTVAAVANKASQLGLHKSDAALKRMGQRNVAIRGRPETAHVDVLSKAKDPSPAG